jgi:hypothetical protein
MTIVNTTFFYAPETEADLQQWLRQVWLPMARQVGCDKPTCLRMDSAEKGINRMALHTNFADVDSAQSFVDREIPQMMADLERTFGKESVLTFLTLLHEVDL